VDEFSFWQRWLFVVSLILIIFGLLMALFNRTVVFTWLFDRQINPVFWGTADAPGGAAAFQGWIYGVLGATIAGWGCFVAFVAHHPFKKKERWSWNCLITGLLVWFLIDTSISLYFGVYFNAAFNTILLVLVILPLAFTRKYFRLADSSEP